MSQSKSPDPFVHKLDNISCDLKTLERDMTTTGSNLEDIEVKMNNLSAALEGGKKSWTGDEVRQTFIDFFVQKKNHTFWQSSPVVPVNDPTLLFANAGMNQYKPLFLGTADPNEEMSTLKRAVNSQKCIRAGGKHNDLDDVGKDVYHHTFFEMLGNWSFGDFFKEEAIAWSWELLVNVYGLDPNRLYASYFKGDPEKGLACDNEAREIWLKYLPAERVLGFDCTDNFWEMGATGPCGPCSEIHYDRIGNRDAAHLVNADVADVMEIWNLVFMQFNRESETVFKLLPDKHVDTGMGLERIASILQDKTSNYDTDIFVPIFNLIQEVCGCPAYSGKIGAEDTDLKDMAYRVVADHIRTVTFAITDGCVPSSDGRGYVIRRILRRAVRYGQEILNAPAGFFTKLVPQVVLMMDGAFPGMAAKQDYVMGVIEDEEKSFVRTLDHGVKHFQKVVAQLTSEGKTVVSGKDAHLLFGSMGFPFDLTQLMAEEKGFTVDAAEFEELMEKDRQISVIAHSAKKIVGTRNFSMAAEQTSWLVANGVDATDSSSKYVWHTSTPAEIKAVYMGLGSDDGAGFTTDVTCSDDDTFGVILDATSYYYESGGQINDIGTLKLTSESGDTFDIDVLDCKTYGPYVLHVCSGANAVGKTVKVGMKLTCHVDYENRSFVAPNHTMTHSLNYALRKVLLGDDCEISAKGSCDQKGSLVDSDKLRFDFGWGTALTADEIKSVEGMVNEVIKSELPVFAENVPLADAKSICSLRSVFGERYPDPVRVLSVGVDVQELIKNPDNSEWYKYSVEFCGGTHLSNTKEAEEFIIIEESGIAKGIRRIFGLTRKAAREARARAADLMTRLEQMQQMAPGPELSTLSKKMQLEIDQAVVSLSDKDQLRKAQTVVNNNLKVYNKELLAKRKEIAIEFSEQAGQEAAAGNIQVLINTVNFGADGKIAKTMQDIIKKHSPQTSNFFCSLDTNDTKVGVYTVATADHIKAGLDAKEWSNHVIQAVGAGKGGGKSSQATASIPVAEGQDPEQFVEAILAAAREFSSSKGF